MWFLKGQICVVFLLWIFCHMPFESLPVPCGADRGISEPLKETQTKSNKTKNPLALLPPHILSLIVQWVRAACVVFRYCRWLPSSGEELLPSTMEAFLVPLVTAVALPCLVEITCLTPEEKKVITWTLHSATRQLFHLCIPQQTSVESLTTGQRPRHWMYPSE